MGNVARRAWQLAALASIGVMVAGCLGADGYRWRGVWVENDSAGALVVSLSNGGHKLVAPGEVGQAWGATGDSPLTLTFVGRDCAVLGQVQWDGLADGTAVIGTGKLPTLIQGAPQRGDPNITLAATDLTCPLAGS